MTRGRGRVVLSFTEVGQGQKERMCQVVVILEYRFEHTKVVLPIRHEVEKGIWAPYAPRDLHGRKAKQLGHLGRVERDLVQ